MANPNPSKTEDFNNDASIKVLGNWYEGNSLIRDRKFKSDRIFNNDIDDQLKGKKELSKYPIREQVQRMIHSGKTEGEIAKALDNAIGNLPTEYADQSGSFANKNTRDDVSVVNMVLRNLRTQNPDVTGKSDKELQDTYKEFSTYLDQNLDKMFKDMPFENRKALVDHIKSDKSNADKIIKEQAMNLLKQQGSTYSASELLGELSSMDPSKQDLAIAGLYTISSDPNASAEDRNNYITNFDDSTASEQAELKVSGPSTATETAEGGEMGPSQAGAGGFDQNKPRTVYEQDKDGNWITGEKIGYGALEQWVSKPTLVDGVKPDNTRLNEYYAKVEKENQEKKAIALERSIYDRTRGDATADYDRDLAQEAAYYKRDLDQEEEDYARDIAREDAKQRELNARYDIQRNQDMKRADLIMLGQWTRDDEVAYRNREWDIDDRRDDRLWEEAQQAEENVFRTGQLAMQMGPQYFQSQLDAAEFEKDVLSNASDYIAAAFMQRGEASPFKAVTQADLINGFRSKVRDMMQATEAGFRPPLESPEEIAAQIVGSASGNAASTVGAALEDTYNPNPQPEGSTPAGTNAGTGPAASSSGPPAGPAAGSNTSATDGNPVVSQRDNGDGTVTVFFLDGTSLPISAPTLDPMANAHAKNPNLQSEIDHLNSLLSGNTNNQNIQANQDSQASTSMQGFNPNYELGAGFIGGNEWGTPTAKPAMAEGSEWNAGLPSGAIRPPTVRPPVGGVIHIPSSPTPGSEFEGQQFILPEEPMQPLQSQVFGMPANTGMSDIEQINMVSEQFDAPQSVLPPTGGVMHIPSTQMQESFSYSDDVYGNPAQGAYDAQQAAIAGIGNPAGAYMSGVNTPEQNPFYQYHPSMGFQGPEEESFSVTEDVYKSPAFRLPSTNINQSGFSPEGNNAIPSMRPPQAPIFRGPTKPTYYDFEL